MKHILLFGAGKSATVLIDYLKDLATSYQYRVTIADQDFALAQSKAGNHAWVKASATNVENETERKNLVRDANLVISLLPPSLHYLVALDCVEFGKNLLTASYVDGQILALKQQIEEKNILFLCEMGLDPGIDHMSAMKLINKIKKTGGQITSFKSHCGGLVAPENDDNPWHYKISWNPKNLISAGKTGALFKEDGQEKQVDYQHLFNVENKVEITDEMRLSYYPNRDSLKYISIYHLEEVETFIRTTLRHPDFCFGWKNIIDLKLTDENIQYETDGMSIADFFKEHFDKNDFNGWLNEMLNIRLSFAKDIMNDLFAMTEPETKRTPDERGKSAMHVNAAGELDALNINELQNQAESPSVKMHEANLILKQLFFLGLDSEEMLNLGKRSPAEILQYILEKKLALGKEDKDMIVMMHEIKYQLQGNEKQLMSTLIVKGENSVRTAMAKTVGLPLGIAAKLILNGTITTTGLHIPIDASIYDPVLQELEKHNISFEERTE